MDYRKANLQLNTIIAQLDIKMKKAPGKAVHYSATEAAQMIRQLDEIAEGLYSEVLEEDQYEAECNA